MNAAAAVRYVHDWPMLNRDPQRTGYSALKGDILDSSTYIEVLHSDKTAFPAIADIDSDGKQEIVVSNENAVRTFHGNGTHSGIIRQLQMP